jgi:gliding motility-associated-like protein
LPFIFNWYNGNVPSPVAGAQDTTGVDYINLHEGIYTVTATRISTGCISAPDTVEVRFEPVYPTLIFKTTASVCRDLPNYPVGTGTIELHLEPSDVISNDVVWTDELGAQAGIGNYITGLYPGPYHVNLTTIFDCEVEGDTFVPTEILSYNLVSVNGDQKNDAFVIDCISQFPNNNVKIFNRSGVLVFEADGYNNLDVVFTGFGEKGVYATGNNLPVGTYFYIINKNDGSKPKTGYLELVK